MWFCQFTTTCRLYEAFTGLTGCVCSNLDYFCLSYATWCCHSPFCQWQRSFSMKYRLLLAIQIWTFFALLFLRWTDTCNQIINYHCSYVICNSHNSHSHKVRSMYWNYPRIPMQLSNTKTFQTQRWSVWLSTCLAIKASIVYFFFKSLQSVFQIIPNWTQGQV